MTAGSSELNGILAPVLTPFTEDLAPDHDRFLALCRRLMAEGLGLAPFGTTSEGNSLSVTERLELLDALAGAGLDLARVMPGTGCCALPDTVLLTAHAVRLGCGGALMLPPFYYKGVSEDGLFASFAEVIERVGDDRLRVYLYHFPRQSQIPLPLSLIERLLKAYPGTVVGVKDSSGDLANMEATLDAFPGFQVFSGSDSLLLPVLRKGGAGCIAANANLNGPAILRLFNEWQGPDAEALQAEVTAFRDSVAGQPLIATLKAMLAEAMGDDGWRRVRPPLVAI